MPASSRFTLLFAFLITGLLTGLTVPAVNRAEQKKERVIKKGSFPHEPVRIALIKTKNGAVEANKKFADSDDEWLKGLTLRVENTSGKPINYISVSLVILRPEEQEAAGQIPFSEWLEYGASPIRPRDAAPVKAAPAIPPGGSTELTLPDKSFEENKVILQRLAFPDSIERVELIVQEVGFEDGTLWSGGELWQRDPTDPDKWVPLNPPEERNPPSRAGGESTREKSFISIMAASWMAEPKGPLFFNPKTSRPHYRPQAGEEPCKRVGPQLTRVCLGDCVARTRFVYDEPSQTDQPFLTNAKCHNINTGAFCDPVVQIEVVGRRDCPTPQPTPAPTPPPPPFSGCDLCVDLPCGSSCRSCCIQSGGTWSHIYCECTYPDSPVLIDTSGDGFDLTDAAGGVRFDLDADGVREHLSWTAAASDDAWLALDRDGSGAIEDGRELFGNFTAQGPPPPGEERNGFLALAEFDRVERVGNSDGVIDARDAVFVSLRLWRDANHDGVSQPEELHRLGALGVESVSLDYRESRKQDRHGNLFRYRAKVGGGGMGGAGRWAYDVFLIPG